MSKITAVRDYIRSLITKDQNITEDTKKTDQINQPVLNLEDITDSITQEIMIEPVLTNCNHKFEKLALAKHLRTRNGIFTSPTCPICRERITSIVPDDEFVKKIQDQFVKVNGKINEENKKIFDDQKEFLETSQEYDSLRDQSVIPTSFRNPSDNDFSFASIFLSEETSSSPPLAWSVGPAESSYPFNTPSSVATDYSSSEIPVSNDTSTREETVSDTIQYRREDINSRRSNDRRSSDNQSSSVDRREENSSNLTRFFNGLITKAKNCINPPSEILYQKVDQCIRNDNLAQAEIFASRITDSRLKNLSFKKLIYSYLIKTSLDLTHLDNHLASAKRLTRLITDRAIKELLFKTIAQKYIDSDKLIQAMSIVRNDLIAPYNKDPLFEKICLKYLSKATSDILHLDDHLTSATRAIRLITDRQRKEELFKKLAQKYIDNDKLIEAKNIVRDDVNVFEKNLLFEKICLKYLKRPYSLSNVQETFDVISSMPYRYSNDKFYQQLSKICKSNNDIENAQKAIEKMKSYFLQKQLYSDLSNAYDKYSYRELKKAVNIVDNITLSASKDTNLKQISLKFFDIKCFKDSFKTAFKISKNSARWNLYFNLTIKITYSTLFSILSFPFRFFKKGKV